jgi:hypothetical protein
MAFFIPLGNLAIRIETDNTIRGESSIRNLELNHRWFISAMSSTINKTVTVGGREKNIYKSIFFFLLSRNVSVKRTQLCLLSKPQAHI